MPTIFGLPETLGLVTNIAVVSGVVFALIQIRQAASARRDHVAVDIVRTVQTQEVRIAVAKILQLPDNVDPELVRNDPELLEAALAVDSACEMWGCIVYENVVDHRTLDRMVGGWVRGTWCRLGRWVEAERVANRNPNIGEWWQWLFELIEADPDPAKKQGAHIVYRGKANRTKSVGFGKGRFGSAPKQPVNEGVDATLDYEAKSNKPQVQTSDDD